MSLYSFRQDTTAQILSRLGRLEDALPYQTSANVFAQKQGNALFTSLSNDVSSSGAVDLTGQGVSVFGSIPPIAVTPGFAATSASGAGAGSSNIHIYWDGTNSSTVIVIRRPRQRGTALDTESFQVPTGDLNITGLNPSTTYYFLPFWSPNNECMVGWVQGTTGSPQIAFTVNTDVASLAKQTYQFREQLSSGYLSFATAAAMGSSAGTSAGGGGDPTRTGCVMLGTDIAPLGENQEYRNEHIPETQWWRVVTKQGRSLNGSHPHSIYHADHGKARLDSIKVGDWLISETGEDKVVESRPFTRQCTKLRTVMPIGHLYWANGLLSHNQKPNLT